MYILVLSGLPCEVFCQDEPETNQTARSASDDHRQEAGCSPFCLCATCPGFTLPPSVGLVRAAPIVAPGMVVVLPFYQAPYSSLVPGRIWQPPRLN